LTTLTSIAMCVFNGERYLRSQLDSIQSQTILPDELVIVDDVSSDRTQELVEEFISNTTITVNFVKNDVNLGSTKNFELAISKCTGNVIFLADQDDVWKDNKIEEILSVFENNPRAGYVFTNADILLPNGTISSNKLWKYVKFESLFFELFKSGKGFELLLKRSFVTGATMAFRADLIPKFSPVNKRWVHDYWIAIALSAYGFDGIPLDMPLIQYRTHTSQQIGVKTSTLDHTIAKFRSNKHDFLVAEHEKLQDLFEFLSRSKNMDEKKLGIISDYLDHLKIRKNCVSKNWILALFTAVPELFNGRYSKFSNSINSMISDVIGNKE
jgi:glycosyltransferase involved in cell wall biosynthesis